MGSATRILIGLAGALIAAWLALLVALWAARPGRDTAGHAVRLLPDTIRLLRRLAADRSIDRVARARLWVLLAYLLVPIDLVPDIIPVVGYADDVIVAGLALRSFVRRAGPEPVRRHWPGTPQGLAAAWRVFGLPGEPGGPYAPRVHPGAPGRDETSRD